ncbi:unnamed protein product [Urochloa humidicola]
MAHLQSHNRVSSSSPSPAATALVSTGLRLAFDEQQQNNRVSSSPASLFASVSDDLAAQVKQHDDEIDRFIREQGEQLRRALADRLRRHNRAILLKADQSAARRLRDKAAEAEREAARGAELEERLRGEAAAWQAKALSEQAAAVALHAQLQQAAAAAAARAASAEELAAAGPAESSSSAHVNPRRGGPGPERACLGCRLRPASVVLLPCRHLSLCGECFAAGDADAAMACPVCLCVRTGSVEAILC